jgi:ADP-ribose pyrophosphatase
MRQRLTVTPGTTPYTIVQDREAYRGYAKVHEYHLSHQRYDGATSETMTREVFNSGDAVVVLLYDPARDEVLLTEQFRPGPLPRNDNPWVIEAVAGRIDTDEGPEAVARREAVEEAGCPVGRLVKVTEMYCSPGIFAEYVYLFVGEADLAGAGGLHGVDDEHEDIKAMVCSLDEAIDALKDGRLRSAPSFVLVQWLAANRQTLRKAWSEPA